MERQAHNFFDIIFRAAIIKQRLTVLAKMQKNSKLFVKKFAKSGKKSVIERFVPKIPKLAFRNFFVEKSIFCVEERRKGFS